MYLDLGSIYCQLLVYLQKRRVISYLAVVLQVWNGPATLFRPLLCTHLRLTTMGWNSFCRNVPFYAPIFSNIIYLLSIIWLLCKSTIILLQVWFQPIVLSVADGGWARQDKWEHRLPGVCWMVGDSIKKVEIHYYRAGWYMILSSGTDTLRSDLTIKFMYFEKATKIWRNLQIFLELTK